MVSSQGQESNLLVEDIELIKRFYDAFDMEENRLKK